MKKVFLVGATGGLGGHVLRGLLKKEQVHLVVSVRTPSKLTERSSRITVLEGDINAIQATDMEGCDVIIATHSSPSHQRYAGYQKLADLAREAGVNRIIGVGGAGQLLLPNGQIKQTEEGWFPGLKDVTADHERGLQVVRSSGLVWTWVAPAYMPTNQESSGGYRVTCDVWNNTGVIPQVDVARFIVDEALSPQYTSHVVGLSAQG